MVLDRLAMLQGCHGAAGLTLEGAVQGLAGRTMVALNVPRLVLLYRNTAGEGGGGGRRGGPVGRRWEGDANAEGERLRNSQCVRINWNRGSTAHLP